MVLKQLNIALWKRLGDSQVIKKEKIKTDAAEAQISWHSAPSLSQARGITNPSTDTDDTVQWSF